MTELSLRELVLINGGTDGCEEHVHEESAAYQAGQIVGEWVQAIGRIIDAISPAS